MRKVPSACLLLLLPLGLTACGRSNLDLPDLTGGAAGTSVTGVGGAGGGGTGVATAGTNGAAGTSPPDAGQPPPGTRAFDVTATITLTPQADRPASWAAYPKAHPFTLSLDATAGVAIAGAMATGDVASTTTVSGNMFTTQSPIEMRLAASNCGPFIRYDQMSVTVQGDSLRGTARGQATLLVGDTPQLTGFTATLVGTRDLTAPSLRLPTDETLTNPLLDTTFTATEPMPTTAQAQLVDANGTAQPLDANVDQGAVPLVEAFTRMSVVLAYGQTYRVVLGNLIDFAGNRGAPNLPLTFATRPLPPLIPEDGFESSTGATVGGAMVLDGTTRWPAIDGRRSVVVSGAGDTLLPGAARELSVRLAVHPGDTVVRFSLAGISVSEGVELLPVSVRFGAVGQRASSTFSLIGLPTKMMVSASGSALPAFVSAPKPFEFPLPVVVPGADLVFELAGANVLPCSAPMPPTDVIIDDLRIE